LAVEICSGVRMIRLLGLVVGAFFLAGCASESGYQRTTAEFTACSADDIQISDVNTSGANSWKAICKNNAKIYKCDKQGCTELK
jgi:uncharacterized lipoprotein YajG